MSQLTIERATPSKSGKSIVIAAGGNTYYAKPEQGLQNQIGATIDCEITTSEYQGSEMKWINKFRVVSGVTPSAPPAVSQLVQAPWWMPFVSNTVAHAIQAGKIEGPAQIEAWASAAKTAAMMILKDEQEF